MSLSKLALLVLASVALLFLLRWVRRFRRIGLEKAWLPEELQSAALVYSEQVFRARSPVPVVAKLDRGYRNADDVIILVELKTRRVNRPYLSDVIELSAQRLAVQAQTGEAVANHGYVVVPQTGSKCKTAHRVELLSAEDVVALVIRRQAILVGEVKPRSACSEGLCPRCAFVQECKGGMPLA